MRLFYERIKIMYILIFFYLLLEINFKLEPKDKSIIPIAFATDNKFTYPLIVLLTSILYNSKSDTFYYFYIMVPNDFFKKNKQRITGLCKKYKKCKTKFLNMGEKYKDWKTDKHYSAAVYYRLSLSNNIKDLDKIIYLDCDTMVHNDLSNLYNIEIGDKYYMGFPAHEISHLVINGTRNYINVKY